MVSRIASGEEPPHMPRFYINYRVGGRAVVDDVGQDFPGLQEAKAAALVSARELLADNIKNNTDTPLQAVIIANDRGQDLITIRANEVLPDPRKPGSG
jgi:hypothetical protein